MGFPATVVEIEINTNCNRRCDYCPLSKIPRRRSRFIEMPQMETILQRLREVNFCGRISYHLYNEPLLHPQIDEIVRLSKDILPKALPVIFTNGDFLTDQLYSLLIQVGTDHFVITDHGGKNIPLRPHTNIMSIHDHYLTNRGGIVSYGCAPLLTSQTPCLAPSEMLIVTIDGDVLCCYEDFAKRNVMGNINVQPISDIWFSPRFRKFRSILASGSRAKALGICATCNNLNHKKLQNVEDIKMLGRTLII